MRYSLHEFDTHDVVATTVAADRDEALEWFSEKLRLMLTFEGDPVAAAYLLDEWPESLHLAHTPNPTIPVFVVSAVAAQSSGIPRRWLWSDRCVSRDAHSSQSNTDRV
jgi:hypothetical protein